MPESTRGKAKRNRAPTSKNSISHKANQGKKGEGIVAARIEFIANMMRNLTYVRGETMKQLAKEWKLSEQRVGELTSAASKRVREEVSDPERVTVDVCSALDKALRGAVATCDWRSVAALGKTWATIVGAVAPARMQIAEVPLANMNEEEREKLVREAIATLRKEKS